jgi:proteasome lid subunit RPN8/RPN11
VNVERGTRVSRAALNTVIAHAQEAAPAECCGLLLARDGVVVEAIRTANVAENRLTRFVVDPQGHIEARRDARRRGLHVAGFYHSHPRSAASPSETDRAEASYPDHLYLIVSLAQEAPEVALFSLDGADCGNFVRLPLVTVA